MEGASAQYGLQDELGSDEMDSGRRCDQCNDSGDTSYASGYCADCVYFLCSSCILVHRRQKASKDHTVLIGKDMPETKPQDIITEHCSKHAGIPITLYCESEKKLACAKCLPDHKSCVSVIPISEVSNNFRVSLVLQNIHMTSQQHDEKVGLYRNRILEYRTLNNNWYARSLEDFQSAKAVIQSRLDCLGEEVATGAKELRDKNEKKLDTYLEKVTTLELEMKSRVSHINLKQMTKKFDQLFIAAKKNSQPIADAVEKLDKFVSEIQIQAYRFEASSAMKQVMNDQTAAGSMICLSGNVSCDGEVNAKSPGDKGKCNIYSIIELFPGVVLVTDVENKCLKLIDFNKGIIVQRREFETAPRSVAPIPDSRIAVSLSFKQEIQFFTADENLRPCGGVATNGLCDAIVSIGDQLVVSYISPKIQIMDLGGQVLKSFTTDTTGKSLNEYVGCMNISPQHTSIYLSNRDKDTVTCLTTKGNVEWVYKDEELKYPMCMATGADGCIFVCSANSHSIHVISPGGMKLREIQLAQFGMKFPSGICYSREMGALYISSLGGEQMNYIKRLFLQ